MGFEQVTLDIPNYQGNAVVNYTEREVPYTWNIEHKHSESFEKAVYDNSQTVIFREYSTEWKPGMGLFYTVNNEKNCRLYLKYNAWAN